ATGWCRGRGSPPGSPVAGGGCPGLWWPVAAAEVAVSACGSEVGGVVDEWVAWGELADGDDVVDGGGAWFAAQPADVGGGENLGADSAPGAPSGAAWHRRPRSPGHGGGGPGVD